MKSKTGKSCSHLVKSAHPRGCEGGEMMMTVVFRVHRTRVLILIAAMIDRIESVGTHTLENKEEQFLQFTVMYKMHVS